MNRQHMLDQLELVPEWDIVIIGGGATGLGTAVDAASRGYKTLLVEQYDFAKGTSGRSTKLIHGGVRYLAQGNIKLVRESLKERGLLLKNAPHICHEIPFILPAFHIWEKWFYGFGLKFYALLSGKRGLGKTVLLKKKKAAELLPEISKEKLKGGVLYHDGQFDDCRLAIALAQTAADKGATLINYCKLISITKTDKRIEGIFVHDQLSGKSHEVKTKVLINATGVFSDKVMLLDDAQHKPLIAVSQGIHLVVDKSVFSGKHAMMIPKTDDGRVLFAVPWHNRVIIGTTDTPLKEISIEPFALKEEIEFIIRHINLYLDTHIKTSDIKSVFAGLRPLISIKGKKTTSILPRDYSTIVSETGLITITGGKWTTYRKMAESSVDNAIFVGTLPKRKCVTETLRIHGYTKDYLPDDLLSVYGSDAIAIRQLIIEQPELKEKINPQLPYLKAEVIWAIRHEMAMTVEDVLSRRTRSLILDAKAAIDSAVLVAAMMAKEMHLSDGWQKQQIKDFTEIANQYLIH